MKLYTLPIILASTLLAQAASAQASSSTPVIGYYKFDVPSGKSIWSCNFVTRKEFQSAATSVAPTGANTVITQTGAGWSTNQFQTSATPLTTSSHYVEILSGPTAGSVADIVSNTSSTVTIEGNWGAASFTYAIHKHATVLSIFKTAGLGPFEDEVLIFDDQGVAHKYLYDDTVGAESMVDATTFSNKDNDVVYPGQAFVLTIGTVKTLTFGGAAVSYVHTGPLKIPLYGGGKPNLVGLMDPIVASAPLTATATNERHNVGAIGLQGAGLAAFQDEIGIFGISGGAFTKTATLYYDDTPPGFIVDSITFADAGATPIPNGTGFLVTPLGASTVYTQPQLVP